MTAHKYIEENCYDLKIKYIRGLSADMDDLQTERGRLEADAFFEKTMFDIQNDIYKTATGIQSVVVRQPYKNTIEFIEKHSGKDVVIVTNSSPQDNNLNNMIIEVQNKCIYPVRVINIREYKFGGGCLGCFDCTISGKCIYKDNFDEFLRTEIQTADAVIYAFTIENHYTHSSFKCFDDRQFCNGHRAVTHGKITGYIVSGNLSQEPNIQTLIEARSEVSGMYLCGVATDEYNTQKSIDDFATSLNYCIETKMTAPKNFYGVGGTKIFRDLVYLMQGFMQADHKFYKQTGVYDFPHKQKGMIWGMKMLGFMMKFDKVKKEMRKEMPKYILMPYQKVLDNTKPKNN